MAATAVPATTTLFIVSSLKVIFQLIGVGTDVLIIGPILRVLGPSSSRRVRILGLLKTHDRRTPHHGLHLPERHVARQVLHPAVGRNDDSFGRRMRQRLADTIRHYFWRFDSH